MFAAVVPVHNEELRVGRLLRRLLTLPSITKIFVIQNGSNQSTQAEVESVYAENRAKIKVLHFEEALGIDVPRAIGAKLVYESEAAYALFIDGDLVGEITSQLSEILSKTAMEKPDLALINCYPQSPPFETLNEPLFFFRRLLNKELGIYNDIGIASPSHGPHLVSRRLLSLAPWEDFCVPPTLLVHASFANFDIRIVGEIPHICLGSQIKNSTHSRQIVDTIVGDCLEALALAKRVTRRRDYEGKAYLGYHKIRRLDLLQQFLSGRLLN
ncbi:MAG: glycosyltransferase [Dethiobacter sp.]|nr:glycosyltransferase [Dethiobacter sp.]MBS3989304.1 glycosyltransferase [Dethiobacter sp.]